MNDELRWFILDRNGQAEDVTKLPSRPVGARPAHGDPFVPWYKHAEHVHIEDGRVVGIHARGIDAEDVARTLRRCLQHELELIARFGGSEDLLLPDALAFLNSLE